MFPSFKQTSQNQHKMTRAGVTFLRGAYEHPFALGLLIGHPLPTDTTRQ